MLELLKEELNKHRVFNGNIPDIVKNIANSIPSDNIPYRMKLAIAMSEIVRFTSQFRRNITHWNGSSIPINSITFCIAKSGASKDSSVNACKKCFDKAYSTINDMRTSIAKEEAITKAMNKGLDDYDKFEIYKQFLIPIPPLVIGVSTIEGLLQNLYDLSKNKIGAGYQYTGEVGAELANNADFTNNLKAVAELTI